MQLANYYAWILILTALITGALIPVILSRKQSPGRTPILFLLGGIIVWTLGYGIQMLNTQLEAQFFWTKIVYIGIITVPVSLLLYALEYNGYMRRMPRWFLWLFLVEPVIFLLLIWTNEWHKLIFRQVSLVTLGNFVSLTVTQRGAGFWAHTAFAYIILFSATFLMIRGMIHSSQLYRGQSASILIGSVTPWVGNIIHLTTPQIPIDTTPLFFAVTGIIFTYATFHYQLFKIVPIARDLVLETMEDIVLVLDADHQIIEANPSARALTTPTSKSLIGRPAKEIFAGHWENLRPFLTPEGARTELNLGSPSQPHWYELRVSIIRNRTKTQLIGRLLVFHDIQNRKQSEVMLAGALDQALQASLHKSQLIANVSHDLRTPLNAILGFGEMLLEGVYEPLSGRQTEALTNMVEAAQQVNLFISDLLDQSLIEKGKFTLYPTDFSPTELAAGINHIFIHQAMEKGLLLQIEIDPGLPKTLFGDVKRLQQILINLIGNAIKYTEQGFVYARLYAADSITWAMEVTDSGCGIPTEAQSYIFEPFRQFEGSPRRKQTGVGLGLAIVKKLVTMMDGTIELESQPGKGSTFRVNLPLNQKAL